MNSIKSLIYNNGNLTVSFLEGQLIIKSGVEREVAKKIENEFETLTYEDVKELLATPEEVEEFKENKQIIENVQKDPRFYNSE
jgi:hypothetical protein